MYIMKVVRSPNCLDVFSYTNFMCALFMPGRAWLAQLQAFGTQGSQFNPGPAKI